MSKHKTKKQNNRQQKTKVLLNPIMIYFPLTSIICVSLIVRLKIFELPAELQGFWKKNYVSDFFSYYKSILIYIFIIMMFCIFGYYMLQGLNIRLMQEKSLYLYYGSMAVCIVCNIVHCIF